jgi:hypothetical protein
MSTNVDTIPADKLNPADQLRRHLELVIVDPQTMTAHLAWLRTRPVEHKARETFLAEDIHQVVNEGLAHLADELLCHLALDAHALTQVSEGVLGQLAAPSIAGWKSWDDAFLRQGERLDELYPPPWRSPEWLEGFLQEMRHGRGHGATRENAPRSPRRSSHWVKRMVAAGIAAGLLGVFFSWHLSVVAAEKEKLRQEVERAKRQMRELKDAGYLDPFGADILVAAPDRLVVAGWVHPGVIERVEVYWTDTAGSKPEVLHHTRQRNPGETDRRVTFSGAHAYQLGGSAVKPRVRAMPFPDSEEVLKELHKGSPPLEVTKPFFRPPQGLMAEDPSAPFSEAQAAAWVLERGGSLEIALPSGETVRVENAGKLPQGSFFVHGIGFSQAKVQTTDADLRRLGGLRKLSSLDLSKTGVTDAGLQSIKELTTLTTLRLVDCAITDSGLKSIQSLQSLDYLDLQNTNITDQGVEHLKAMPNLRWLSFWQTRITDSGLSHVRAMTTLNHLRLGGRGITDKGMEYLKGLTHLRTFYVGTSPISDAGLVYLKELGALEELGLDRTDITDAGLEHLQGMKKLWFMNLADCRITDAAIANLEKLPALKRVYLNGTKVTNGGIEKLTKALGPQSQIHH